MQDVLTVITQVGILTFVIASMATLGLKLALAQIIGPLRDPKLVGGLLVANFIVVPGLAILAAKVLPMEDATSTAIILIGCCAGAPFLPTLAKLSHGDESMAVGAMVVLMVITIAFAPIVVPLAVSGATIAAWDIAQSLLLFMLLPLAAGLLVRARYPQAADAVVGGFSRASTVGLALGIVSALLVTWRQVFESIGSWIFLGTAIVIVVGLIAGWAGGWGRSSSDRVVLGLAAAQRNIAAALVIAASLGNDVMVRTLVAALMLPIVLILLSGELGKRKQASSTSS